MSIDILLNESRLFEASSTFKEAAQEKNQNLYEDAQKDRLTFWEKKAKELTWFKPWDQVLEWQKPFAKWFVGGKLNASVNCLDIHLSKKADKTAIIWEAETGEIKRYTYQQLSDQVNVFAAALKHNFNIQKGDRVTIYMPMTPESAIAILACARIGAIHSVVFAGFSADSLQNRIEDSNSKLLITADGAFRRGNVIPLREIVNTALSKGCKSIEATIVLPYVNPNWKPENENEWCFNHIMSKEYAACKPEEMDSEDILFILYTSGTTGKPKGIIHTTGGYMTHAKYSTRAVFDLKDNDIYWCTADIGWITGHTYLIYGPLSNGGTVLMYEGSPDYPEKNRFWDIIERHKVSIFYTAPTAIRAFMKWGDSYIDRHNLSSLRLLGSVGEPINPEAWIWYYEKIGSKQCPIVDTWWQTETGGIMISNLPALNPMKPGSTGLPLPGIEAKILSPDEKIIKKGGGLLSITEPWPSMLRGIWGDQKRYKETYWKKFKTYFAGDGASVDEDGYFRVLGRVDDVLNVAGHRIGTMEVESALVEFPTIAEAAVVGIPDEIKGQSIAAFVILEDGYHGSIEKKQEIITHVANSIGPIAKPKAIIFTPELPKTRSGKIMRRILKSIAENKSIGDISTLANPESIEYIQKELKCYL